MQKFRFFLTISLENRGNNLRRGDNTQFLHPKTEENREKPKKYPGKSRGNRNYISEEILPQKQHFEGLACEGPEFLFVFGTEN